MISIIIFQGASTHGSQGSMVAEEARLSRTRGWSVFTSSQGVLWKIEMKSNETHDTKVFGVAEYEYHDRGGLGCTRYP